MTGIEEVGEISGRDYGRDQSDDHKYTRTFQVITTAPQVPASVVKNADGIPGMRDVYSVTYPVPGLPDVTVTDTMSVVVRKRAVQQDRDNPTIWVVTVEYEWDPTQRPRDIVWGFTRNRKATKRDVPGTLLKNLAGDYFAGGIEVDDDRLTVSVQKNIVIEEWNPSQAIDLANAVNNDEFSIQGVQIPQYSAKMTNYGGTYRYESGFEYYVVRFEIEFNADLWHPHKVLNEGYRYYDLATNRLVMCRDGDGLPYSTPTLLDQFGQPLPRDAEPVYREFELYKLRSFAPLDIAP